MTPDLMKAIALAAFAATFTTFPVVVGNLLRTRGKVFLNHIFATQPAIADSVHFPLNLGFYLLCGSLLLWNLGVVPDGHRPEFDFVDLLQSVSTRLGTSIFAVAAFHSLNILVLSVLNRSHVNAAK